MSETELSAARIRVAEQEYAANLADAGERVRFQVQLADRALQALMLAHGGALIGLFTFVGNAGRDAALHFSAGRLKLAFGAFCIGLALALAAHILAFLSQDRFYNQAFQQAWHAQNIVAGMPQTIDPAIFAKLNRQGMAFYGVGLIVATLSILLFVGGAGLALWAVV
ncbi:MAG: hypothetical protein ABW043_16745 [Devosia sp.]|uniref:hypothetical protein n=1 Tax=Devosia sp. TaxID=1871048 RepID=UPI00339817C7